MSEDQSDNIESKNVILEKIRNYVGVASGAGTAVVGAATGDPISTMGGAVSLFSSFITLFMRKNGEEFFKPLWEKMGKLELIVDGFSREKALNKDKVLNTILELYPVIVREYKEEKRELLRNAILNVALEKNPDNDLTSTFLKWIDEFTPSHIRILKFLENPKEYMKQNHIDVELLQAGNHNHAIPQIFPELKDTYIVYLNDLDNKQFIMQSETLYTDTKSYNENVTPTASQFLRFIESPFKDKSK